MSTPTPEPTADTVVADVHQVLDTAKTQVADAVAAAEHLDFGALASEAKQLVHDTIEVPKAEPAKLFPRHGSDTPVPTQAPPPDA